MIHVFVLIISIKEYNVLVKAFTLFVKGLRKCIGLLRYVCLLYVVLGWLAYDGKMVRV